MKRLALVAFVAAAAAVAQTTAHAPAPRPALDLDAFVMVEVWPEVGSVTLTAYFLDGNYRKNENLCRVAKETFDRDQAQRAKEQRREYTSWRDCLPVQVAREKGYIL